jgi:hypothetical protein
MTSQCPPKKEPHHNGQRQFLGPCRSHVQRFQHLPFTKAVCTGTRSKYVGSPTKRHVKIWIMNNCRKPSSAPSCASVYNTIYPNRMPTLVPAARASLTPFLSCLWNLWRFFFSLSDWNLDIFLCLVFLFPLEGGGCNLWLFCIKSRALYFWDMNWRQSFHMTCLTCLLCQCLHIVRVNAYIFKPSPDLCFMRI